MSSSSTSASTSVASTAANKKKQDEKLSKLLRDIASLSFNKQCCDCNQKGPTYVNVTMGTFVCTSCCGILRGLNPPHRVKSINMATFTQDEIDFIKAHGNHYCQLVYMNLFDSTTGTQPDSRDAEKLREFLTQKYERKRWFTPPNDFILNQVKQETELLMNGTKKNATQNGRSNLHQIQRVDKQQQQQQISQPTPHVQQKREININTSSFMNLNNNSTNHKNTVNGGGGSLFDDSFTSYSTFDSNSLKETNTVAATNNNFANFDMFANFESTTVVTNNHQATNLFSNQNLQPTSTVQQPQQQKSQNQNSLFTTPNNTNSQNNSDKYSALAELDSIFQPTSSSSLPVQPSQQPPPSQPQQQPTVTNPFAAFTSFDTSNSFFGASSNTNTTNSLPHQMQPTPFIQAQFNGFPQMNTAALQTSPPQPQPQQQQQPHMNHLFPQGQFNMTHQAPIATAISPLHFNNNNFFMPTSIQNQVPVSQSAISTNNPFFNIAQQQSLTQRPKTNSTNPFL